MNGKIKWNNELLEDLSSATGKPVECLKRQIRKFAEEMDIKLEEYN